MVDKKMWAVNAGYRKEDVGRLFYYVIARNKTMGLAWIKRYSNEYTKNFIKVIQPIKQLGMGWAFHSQKELLTFMAEKLKRPARWAWELRL